MAEAPVVDLAAALVAADSNEELARLARDAVESRGTECLCRAVDLVRAAAAGEDVGVPAADPSRLWRIRRLVRRDEVLAVLYEAEQRGEPPDTGDLDERGAATAAGVWEERADLDQALAAAAPGWRVGRMPAVDRNVLRLGLWELRHRPDLSPGVILSEAVRLAKAYSTERSGGFVNGVLAHLVGRERPPS